MDGVIQPVLDQDRLVFCFFGDLQFIHIDGSIAGFGIAGGHGPEWKADNPGRISA